MATFQAGRAAICDLFEEIHHPGYMQHHKLDLEERLKTALAIHDDMLAALKRIAGDAYTAEDMRITSDTPKMIWQTVAEAAVAKAEGR